MSRTPRSRNVAIARERLRAAIEGACLARGEAQWTHGYRVAGKDSPKQEQKQRQQWRIVDRREKAVVRAIAAYSRAIRGAR